MFDLFQDFAIQQIVLPLLLTAVTGLVGWVAALYNKWTGQQIEARHREALQSALENAVKFAINSVLNGKLPTSEAETQKVLNAASTYVQNSVPDAVNHFQVKPKTLMDLLTAKLPIKALEVQK